MIGKIGLVATLAILAAGAVAHATTTNYVQNGSFESGFSNWEVTTGAGAVNPGKGPQIAVTDGKTKNIYGDVIASDNAISPDPDSNKGGVAAAYFVDDVATETLSQKIYLTAGVYEVGFDLFATASGYNNKYDSLFTASIAGTTVTSGDISQYPKATWEHFAANADVLYSGYYNVNFTFQGGAAPANDILVDDVYAINPSTLPGSGTAVVPEPASIALMATALGMALIARGRIARRK
jgi:hypothetical protein